MGDLLLRPHQFEFVCAPNRIAGMVSGRGSGKSWAGGVFAAKMLTEQPGRLGLAGASNPAQAQAVVLPSIKRALGDMGVKYVFGEPPPWFPSRFESHVSVLSVQTGGQMFIRSLHKSGMDRTLRGLDLSWIWIDEARDCPEDAFDILLAALRQPPMLIRITTTPNGDDWVRKRILNEPNALVIRATTLDNPWLPDEFEKGLRKWLDDDTYRQEVLGELVFRNTGLAFKFDRGRHVRDVGEPSHDLPLSFSIDLNVSPLCGVIMQVDEDAGTAIVYDEVFIKDDATTRQACERFMEKYPERDFDFPALEFMCDEAGRARATRGGITDIQIMEETLAHYPGATCLNGFNKPRVRDKINNVNALLDPPGGANPRLLVSDSCPRLIEDLSNVRWGKDMKLDKTDSQRTHSADALADLLWRLLGPSRGRGSASWDPEVNHG